jgi:CheY-like chemotaxis protein
VTPAERPVAAPKPPLAGCRVLLIEDEALISMMIAEDLTAAGAVIVGTADRLEPALEAADRVAADVAVLDMNLAGRSAAPVIRRLRRRGVAVVIVSGYGEEGRPDGHDGPLLTKPFETEMLIQAVAGAAQPHAVQVPPGRQQRHALAKARAGRRGPWPTSQKPPSSAGPNTASARPNARKAAAMSAAPRPGMSVPTRTARRCGASARAMRAPRSPWPCHATGTRCGQRCRARSGVTHSTVRQRRSRPARASSAAT